MGAPSGCSGVQRVPKAGQSCGFFSPCRICAGDALAATPAAVMPADVEAALGVVARRTPGAAGSRSAGSRRCRARRGRRPRRPRAISFCAGRLPSRVTARAYWFSTPARPSSSCAHRHVDALQQVERLEAGDHDGHAVARGERLVLLSSPSPRRRGRRRGSPAPGCPARRACASIAGGTSTCETSIEKFVEPELAGLPHRHGVGRARWSRSRRRRRRPARSGCCCGELHARRAASRPCARRRPAAFTREQVGALSRARAACRRTR